MLLISFGAVLCILIVAPIAWMVLTNGERTYELDDARLIFTISFELSFLSYLVVVLRRAASG